MSRIPDDFIQDILAQTDIVPLIQSRVGLTHKGQNYLACCPFHEEKTPSFTVSSTKQFYHCFGCKANGNAIGFLMAFDKLDFRDAVEFLAKQLGRELPEEANASSPQTAKYNQQRDHLSRASAFYQQQLKTHASKSVPIDYLKSRQITGEIAKRYAIGYAPPGWDHLVNQFKGDTSCLHSLLDNGLVLKGKQQRMYDRFRNRIVFPIRNFKGETIAFGGRVLDPNDQPKYLNSPETKLFQKRRTLYGLYEAICAKATDQPFVLVEGYLDVIALAQHGFPNALACLGTALTEEHLKLVNRYSKHLIFCFDGDTAGTSAALSALNHLIPLLDDNSQYQFVFLPEGEDPDSFLKKFGHDAFAKVLQEAKPFTSVLFEHLHREFPCDTIDQKVSFVAALKERVSQLSNPLYQTLLLEQLRNYVHMDVSQLREMVFGKSPTHIPVPKRRTNHQSSLNPSERALAMVLQHGELLMDAVVNIPQALLQTNSYLNQCDQLLALYKNSPGIPLGAIMEQQKDAPLANEYSRLASMDLLLPSELVKKEYQQVVQFLIKKDADQRKSLLLKKAQAAPLSESEKQELKSLMQINKLESPPS